MSASSPSHADLRRDGETLAATLPPLLADAEHLASTMLLGEHGRRRSGTGEEFWQYRPAMASDEARLIDWRRSARSDTHYIREKEWQAAQSVVVWVDGSQSMDFASPGRSTKADRARLLAMAVSILLLRRGVASSPARLSSRRPAATPASRWRWPRRSAATE